MYAYIGSVILLLDYLKKTLSIRYEFCSSLISTVYMKDSGLQISVSTKMTTDSNIHFHGENSFSCASLFSHHDGGLYSSSVNAISSWRPSSLTKHTVSTSHQETKLALLTPACSANCSKQTCAFKSIFPVVNHQQTFSIMK